MEVMDIEVWWMAHDVMQSLEEWEVEEEENF